MNIGGIKMKKLFSLLLMTLALIACIAPGALAALQDDASCAHHLHSADCGGLASGGGACSFVCEDCRDMLQGMVNALPKANEIDKSNWRDAAMLLSAMDAARLQATSGTIEAVNWDAYEDAALACELMQDDTLNELARIAVEKSMRDGDGSACTPSFAFVDEYGIPAEVSLDNCLTVSGSPFSVSVGETVILHVRPGTYTIEEYVDGSYTMTATLNGEPAEDNRITLVAGGDYRLSLVNRPSGGSLTVSNTVVSSRTADKDKAFEFTVTLSDDTIIGTYGRMTFDNGAAAFTLKDGESMTAEGLPVGLMYTVAQAAADGFATTTSNASGRLTRDVAAAFTNTRRTGSLTVSNTVVSSRAADKDKAFEFTVTLGDTAISGTYGGMIFDNGAAAFTLKDGESVTAQGLPVGLAYTVTQASADDFAMSKSGDTGIIAEGTAAAFINTRMLAVSPDQNRTSTIELAEGMSALLSVTAIGGAEPYSYQWYADTGSGFKPLADANSPEFRTPAAAADNSGDRYCCIVTDAAQSSVRSGVFIIRVSDPAQLPKTGDSSRTGLWAMLMLLSASGFLALSRRRSRA